MTRLIIAGSSHAITLRAGMALLASACPDKYKKTSAPDTWEVSDSTVRFLALGGARFELDEFSAISDGRVRLIGAAAESMQNALGTITFDRSVAWAFINIVNTRRVFVQRMWRRYAPSALGPMQGRAPLTEAVFRSIMLAEQEPVRSLYTNLAAAGVPVVALETPRIRHDLPQFEPPQV